MKKFTPLHFISSRFCHFQRVVRSWGRKNVTGFIHRSINLYWIIINGVMLAPLQVLASDAPGSPKGIEALFKYHNINDFIKALIGLALDVGVPIAAIMIMYSGFKFVTARGNPGEIEKAKELFFYTVIGAAILLGAFVIRDVIEGTVGKVIKG